MASFTVDTAQVASSASDVSRISEDVETTVASMMSRLISLQNEWQGEASSSFQDLINDWRATQRTVKDSLDEIGRVLGEAGRIALAEVSTPLTQLVLRDVARHRTAAGFLLSLGHGRDAVPHVRLRTEAERDLL